MSRLILVPQYPAKLRYQEWWFTSFPIEFAAYFSEVIILGKNVSSLLANCGYFSPMELSIQYEAQQIVEYMNLKLQKDDILLLNDLSYPGLFANVLFHKRPSKCFAICHATSKNRYDYFTKDRKIKYPIEKATAKLFNKIFVATNYHKEKLGWGNLIVQPFPIAPFPGKVRKEKNGSIIIVSRPGIQKRTKIIEKKLRYSGWIIDEPITNSWEEYYQTIANATVLLITAKEETYGYQVIDAITNGCIPIAPNKYSYPELLPKEYLYNNYEELDDLLFCTITCAINSKLPAPKLLVEKEAKMFFENLLRHMLQ